MDTTLRQIQPYKFDLSKLYATTWEGRATYVVGAASASDTTAPQFWIDTDRMIVVRMLLHLNPSAPNEIVDIRLAGLSKYPFQMPKLEDKVKTDIETYRKQLENEA